MSCATLRTSRHWRLREEPPWGFENVVFNPVLVFRPIMLTPTLHAPVKSYTIPAVDHTHHMDMTVDSFPHLPFGDHPQVSPLFSSK